ncbi:hypothetical protein E2C01_052421 [Portunus trituberculatus]|uniref:Uncharacterized protein n=1 Tax=Portunus trituberculatus TaxID=210409 RepID=A0A5B7GLI0_PORTR|nr:hypothetical protein [Portunus trituberculatus]
MRNLCSCGDHAPEMKESPSSEGTCRKTETVPEEPSQREVPREDDPDPSTRRDLPDTAVKEEPNISVGLTLPSSVSSSTTEEGPRVSREAK